MDRKGTVPVASSDARVGVGDTVAAPVARYGVVDVHAESLDALQGVLVAVFIVSRRPLTAVYFPTESGPVPCPSSKNSDPRTQEW